MWCSTCQQDVPGVGSPASGPLRCAKCSQPLTRTAADSVTVDSAAVDSAAVDSAAVDSAKVERLLGELPRTDDDWALEAELRGVQRMLSSLRADRPWAKTPIAVDEPHAGLAGWHAPPPQRASLSE